MNAGSATLTFDGLGAAFYPDQQQRSSIPAYVERLAEANISFVRMAEFAWDKLEPEENEFRFEWLDEVLELLNQKNIKALLCTPTAAPPVWMSERYGEIHPITRDGKSFSFGTRQYVCLTSPTFRSLAERIVRAMGAHYANDRRVIGWQIDNEVGYPFCFCQRCLKLFQKFCKEKFVTIEDFNNALQTHFWGQSFQNFEQIVFPVVYNHPSMWQLYHQFFSWVTVDCFSSHATALRGCGVTVPISTNTMLTWYGYEHEAMMKHMDYASGDYYFASNIFGTDFAGDAFVAAYLRGLKPSVNIRYNEFQCAKEHGTGYVPLPGEIRNRTLTHIGLGADHICYFRWDCCLSGAERDTYGVIRSTELPGRGFAEIKKLGAELKEWQAKLDGSQPVPNEVALLYSYETQYDIAENIPHDDLNGEFGNGYPLFMSRHFRALIENRIMPDIIFPGGDFSRYKLIIAPALYVLTQTMTEKIQEYVRNGGFFLMLPLSGIVDWNSKVSSTPAPGPLCEMFGIRIVDYGRYHERMGSVKFRGIAPELPVRELTVDRWIDEIIPASGTKVLAVYSGRFHEGLPAMTSHRVGKGTAFYLGTWFGIAEDLKDFYSEFTRQLNLSSEELKLPEQVYAVRRIKDKAVLTFIINSTGNEQSISLPGEKKLELAPYNVIITEGYEK